MKLPKTNIMLILAVMGLTFAMTWFVLLMFIQVPEANKDTITFFSGVLAAKCVSAIFDYYFGSSKGSADKTEFMNNSNT